MHKIDLKKLYKGLFAARSKPMLVEVPPLSYLMVDGHGDPNDNPLCEHGVAALYGLAYTLKFMLRKQDVADYGVMGLEGLWWADDPAAFGADSRELWQWTFMILQPDCVTPEAVDAARAELLTKKKDVPRLAEVRLATLDEGLCAQVMHTGPFSAEDATIRLLHDFIAAQGKQQRGKHHELYLNDPRRTAPERLRVILRQPVA